MRPRRRSGGGSDSIAALAFDHFGITWHFFPLFDVDRPPNPALRRMLREGYLMDMTSPAPDNLAELLDKVVVFTTSRRNVLYRNIREAQTPGFVPHDMPVGEFAQAMNEAVAEHVTRQRLLFRDTENIAFGPNGQMQVSTVVDEHAQTLLAADHDEYLEHQISKLLENSLNRAVAEDLLKIKHETLAGSSSFHGSHGHPETDSTDDSPSPWDGCE